MDLTLKKKKHYYNLNINWYTGKLRIQRDRLNELYERSRYHSDIIILRKEHNKEREIY